MPSPISPDWLPPLRAPPRLDFRVVVGERRETYGVGQAPGWHVRHQPGANGEQVGHGCRRV